MTSPVEVKQPLAATPIHNANSSTQSISKPAPFDPKKHLAYSPPLNTLMMEDLSHNPTELSAVAHTEPFQLLSHEGVLAHRREIFSQGTLDNCMHHTRPGSVQIRGYAPRYAPFIHEFWNSPEVLDIVSKNAGIELVPVMPYETGHVNFQLGPDGIAGKFIYVEPAFSQRAPQTVLDSWRI